MMTALFGSVFTAAKNRAPARWTRAAEVAESAGTMTSANILGPGRADDLGGEASRVAGGVRVPAAQPGGGDQRRTQSRADDGGQRVQAADQQVPALDLVGPDAASRFWYPRARRGSTVSQDRGWRGAD